MLGEIAQVVVALLLVLIMFVIGFAVYNSELVKTVRQANQTKKNTMVISGVADLSAPSPSFYDTQDTTKGNYRDIPLAVNQRGGAEFTYNFWIWKDSSLSTASDYTDIKSTPPKPDEGLAVSDYILFLKGSSTPVSYKTVCDIQNTTVATSTASGTANTKTDILVKCPLVKLENGADVLTVEFNTVQSPDAVQKGATNMCATSSSSWSQMKGHKLSISGFHNTNYLGRWFMVTVIIQDTFPTDQLPGRNSVRCRIYINGVLTLDHYTDPQIVSPHGPTILNQNKGNLYIAPTPNTVSGTATSKPTSTEKLLMGNLEYVNYALTPTEITSRFSSGVSLSAVNGSIDLNKTQYQIKSTPFNSALQNQVHDITSF